MLTFATPSHAVRRAISVFAITVVGVVATLLPLRAQTATPEYDPDGQLERLERIRQDRIEATQQTDDDEDVVGRDAWFDFQRSFPYDRIPDGLREKALAETQLMQRRLDATRRLEKGASPMASAQWQSIGPKNVGGRIVAIAVHPDDPSTIYIGAAAGGVWKSTDGGTTWVSHFDKESALVIGSLAIDPVDPNIVFAGTGELRPAADVTYMSDGMFRSTDGGETWTNVGLNSVSAINKIVVDPADHSRIYAVTGRSRNVPNTYGNLGGANQGSGFYVSTDGGSTWSKTASGDYFDMAVDPTDGQTVFIVGEILMMRSTDGGMSFQSVRSSTIPTARSERISVALAPSQPNIVYALQSIAGTSNSNPGSGTLYRSTDDGDTWSATHAFGSSLFSNQGNYNNCIAVDPTDPARVIVGGIDLYRSTDGGTSFSNITNAYGINDFSVTHPDHHIVVFDPEDPTTMYAGSDGGIYHSTNGGTSWHRLTVDLPITQFYSVEVDQTRLYRVYGGAQDNSTQGMFGYNDYTDSWDEMIGGDGFHVVADINDPDYVYCESQYGALFRVKVTTGVGQRTSIDRGISEDGLWSTPIAQNPIDGALYSGRKRLWYTMSPHSSSVSWNSYSPGNNSLLSAVATSTNSASNVIVGSISGEVYYTTDHGTSWNESQSVPTRYVTDLQYDQNVAGRVYLTVSGYSTGHVFRSDDFGGTFTDISGSLPNVPVNTVEVDPADSKHVYVGTDVGAFVCLDIDAANPTWLPFNNGLPDVPVTEMRIQWSSRTLVAATHGRSMFRIDLDNAAPQPAIVTPHGGESISVPSDLEITWVGIEGAADVLISYDGGLTFETIGSGVTGGTMTYRLPLVQTSNAQVKVVSVADSSDVVSGYFELNPQINGQSLGTRGFHAGALTVRAGTVWASDIGSDTIYTLRPPTLLGRQFGMKADVSDTIRDLAYDPTADVFFVLTTAPDGSAPQIVRLDTTGRRLGSIETLAENGINRVSGIAWTPNGLAVMTPGAAGVLHLIDPISGDPMRDAAPLAGAVDNDRRSLVFDGFSFVQGIRVDAGTNGFPAELHRMMLTDSLVIAERTPVVLSSESPVFYGLAFDDSGDDQASRYYYATDTSGAFYRFVYGDLFTTVVSGVRTPSRTSTATILAITPNPVRSTASVRLHLANAGNARLELIDAAGERVATVDAGTLAAGDHDLQLDASTLASGVYHVVLSSGTSRVVARMVVLR